MNNSKSSFIHFCPQLMNKNRKFYEETLKMSMSENCLTLNIFTPINKATLLPVLVLVHGGELKNGDSADYGIRGIIQNFVRKNIIVVTLNYRIGAYGWFFF